MLRLAMLWVVEPFGCKALGSLTVDCWLSTVKWAITGGCVAGAADMTLWFGSRVRCWRLSIPSEVDFVAGRLITAEVALALF